MIFGCIDKQNKARFFSLKIHMYNQKHIMSLLTKLTLAPFIFKEKGAQLRHL